MPSDVHQSLLLWVARKMSTDGFDLRGCDGSMSQGGMWNTLPAPLEFGGVRPDVYGIAPKTGKCALGEAKTEWDIETAHTRKQLKAFGHLKNPDGATMCRLYLAVPRSAAPALDRVLADTGLLGAPHVVR